MIAAERDRDELPMDKAEPFRFQMNGRTGVIEACRPNGKMVRSKTDGDGFATHGRDWPFIMVRYQIAKNARDFIRRIDGEEDV